MATWRYDGGRDVHQAFQLSGEPISKQIGPGFGGGVRDETTGSEIARVNVAKRMFQKEYLDYWNSTERLTGTGRPVDGFIAPVAPFAAARPEKYNSYGIKIA